MINLQPSATEQFDLTFQQNSNYISFSNDTLRLGGIADSIKEYTKQILSKNNIDHEQDSAGIHILRNNLAIELSKEHKTNIKTENVMITHGALGALSMLISTLIEYEDQVILPYPTCNIYQNQVLLGKGKPVFASAFKMTKTENDKNVWTFDFNEIIKTTTTKTKMIIISNPSNPCGTNLKLSELSPMIEWCEQNKIYLIIDESFQDYIFEGQFHSCIPSTIKSNFIVKIGSLSKSFGMNSWRIGFVISNENLINNAKLTQFFMIGSPAVICQYAALYAIEHREILSLYDEKIKSSMNIACKFLNDLQKLNLVSFAQPQAGFHVLFKTNYADSVDLLMDILRKHKVILAPGLDFGPNLNSYLKICFAHTPNIVQQGIDRLKQYFALKSNSEDIKVKESCL
jgi:aspartate aminotransferase